MATAVRLEDFEKGLWDNGKGLAPNGCYYAVVNQYNPKPVEVERNFGGRITRIVGFNGQRFQSAADALHWAVADGRCEMIEGAPMSQRKQIA